MVNLNIQQTHIAENSNLVELVIAESAILEEAKEIIRCQVEASFEHHWHLPAIQRAVLERLRDVIAAEIQRTGHTLNQLPG